MSGSQFSGLAATLSKPKPHLVADKPVSKRSNPDMDKYGFLLNIASLEVAFRKFQDKYPRKRGERPVDRSDLVNKLLDAYVNGEIDV